MTCKTVLFPKDETNKNSKTKNCFFRPIIIILTLSLLSKSLSYCYQCWVF
jgi:hypothetical protein